MTASKLPARPSLESLRKQAKKLARDIKAGDADAIDRARAQLPQAELPLSQREAQLVLAREYGFSGWQGLIKEVKHRLGSGLEWAVSRARTRIHDNDIEGLRELLAKYPALLSWRADENDGGLLGMATDSFGDSFDPISEEHFTRAACAELLIDAGAVVAPSVCDGIIGSRAKTLLHLFHRKGLLPESLKFFAALDDIDGVRRCLDANGDDLAAVNQAFMCACRFQHSAAAALLLDRSIVLDAEIRRQIDRGPGRSAVIEYFIANKPDFTNDESARLWQTFVLEQVGRAVHDGDLTCFVGGLRREPWMLSDAWVKFQVRLIEVAVLNDRGTFIAALLDLDPAVLRTRVPPPSQAIEFAFTYAKTHLLPMLLRIWPLPDDLPHAAGNGDSARVRSWFDAEGRPALGNVANHAPATSVHPREPEWGEVGVQQVLDTALAWAVLNNQFEIADFLLEHGADINTTWSSHEPASILHELVWHKNYEAMQFLIDRGIDMTIKDYRWNSTAQGWAYYAAKDEKMAQWLAEAQQRRERASR
jgi:hypothetical protein